MVCFDPLFDGLDSCFGMEIAINHFGDFVQKVQSVISRLADIVIPRRTLAVDLQLLLGVFKRIAFVAQQMFYGLKPKARCIC